MGTMAVQFYDGQVNDTAHRSFFQAGQYCVQPDNYLTEHVVNGEFYVTSQYPVRADLKIKVYHFVWYDSFNFTEVTMSEGSSRSNTVTTGQRRADTDRVTLLRRRVPLPSPVIPTRSYDSRAAPIGAALL